MKRTKLSQWVVNLHSRKRCKDKEFSTLTEAMLYITQFTRNPEVHVSLYAPDFDIDCFDNCHCERQRDRRRAEKEEGAIVATEGSLLKVSLLSASPIPSEWQDFKLPLLIQGRFRQAGRNLLGECPFLLSCGRVFTLSKTDKKGGIYHCFGCSVGGRFEWRSNIDKIKEETHADLH